MPSFDPIMVKGTAINVSTASSPAFEDNASYLIYNDGPNALHYLAETRGTTPTVQDILDKGFPLVPGADPAGFTDDTTDHLWVVAPAGTEIRIAIATVPS